MQKEENMFTIPVKRGKTAFLSLFVFAALLTGCVTTGGGPTPLTLSDLDTTGWDKTGAFQCYLSSELTLSKLSANSLANDGVDKEAAAKARETIVLPSTLRGRMVGANKRDQYVYVAFEAGDAALPFATDIDGRFSLMTTISSADQRKLEFVDYEGARYWINTKPYLKVEIVEGQAAAPAQPASRPQGPLKPEEAAARASEKFINELREGSIIAVLNISPGDKNIAAFIMEELEFRLTDSKKFRMAERKALDVARMELEFQASGEVSDASARNIGEYLGASIVITGSITGSGTSRRLTLKALDVETAEIISTSREAF
jgi:hypothetical protein